jgi:diguanylate cyclase (GGDEF)-like protein
MELRAYLRILLSKWWVVLITFLFTYGATLAFTYLQQPQYQGRATFVIKLNATFGNDRDLASAVDILSRRTEIATTYTIVANSALVKKLAVEELGLNDEQKSGLTVLSQLVPGTNVMEIIVQSPNAVLARDFTNILGLKTVAQVRDLYETYKLEPLDLATLPSAPIKPNKPLNLVLGTVMGLILGAGFAFLSAYLQAPPESLTNVSILDEQTSAYNKRYFTLRLRQELSRAKRNNYPLAVALINVDRHAALAESTPQVRREALRLVAMRFGPHLRDEDVVAFFDNTIFGFLLPDIAGEEAKTMVERLQTLIAAYPVELDRSGVSFGLSCCAGMVAYSALDSHMASEPDVLMAEVERALNQAEHATYSIVEVLPAPSEYLDKPLLPEIDDHDTGPVLSSVANVSKHRRVNTRDR